jgi:hypothetical protein
VSMCAAPTTGLASFMLTSVLRAGLNNSAPWALGLLFCGDAIEGMAVSTVVRENSPMRHGDASHSRDPSTRPYSQDRSALGQDDNNVCRPYGACLVLYAYPALPRWATLVSRLRRWFIVCARSSRGMAVAAVFERTPRCGMVMRVILGILPLGILPLGLTPKIARLSVRMTRMCAAPTTGLASFFMLTQRFRAGLPCIAPAALVYCFPEKQSRDAVATIVRRTPRCGMVMRVILGILPLGLTPKIARRSVRMTTVNP